MAAAQLRAPLYEDKVVDFLFGKADGDRADRHPRGTPGRDRERRRDAGARTATSTAPTATMTTTTTTTTMGTTTPRRHP